MGSRDALGAGNKGEAGLAPPSHTLQACPCHPPSYLSPPSHHGPGPGHVLHCVHAKCYGDIISHIWKGLLFATHPKSCPSFPPGSRLCPVCSSSELGVHSHILSGRLKAHGSPIPSQAWPSSCTDQAQRPPLPTLPRSLRVGGSAWNCSRPDALSMSGPNCKRPGRRRSRVRGQARQRALAGPRHPRCLCRQQRGCRTGSESGSPGRGAGQDPQPFPTSTSWGRSQQ